ncbi:class I SAM-dependent methyltransferase [Candidatus Dependentiae bacterium]|nr:class I SAM-dependent methyltransferase [Candidatus Dependentiae bacterium]
MKNKFKNEKKKMMKENLLILRNLNQLSKKVNIYKTLFRPGHFYSPIPDLDDLRSCTDKIFSNNGKSFPGINLNEEKQFELLKELLIFYKEMPFKENKNSDNRFYFDNRLYYYSDAIFLYSMIRNFKPQKIIEIGSGFSSCLILDMNEKFFENQIECTFIEPHPERLNALLKDTDKINLKQAFLQDIDLDLFRELNEGDILFIDTSHVTKTGSEVNHILFNILPNLKKGVLIHFHDIFFPFEYPEKWVFEGRAWNEIYILRAFLQYNNEFEIVLFNTYLEFKYNEWFKTNIPLCLKKFINDDRKTGSIWLRKK